MNLCIFNLNKICSLKHVILSRDTESLPEAELVPGQ